MPVGRGDGVKSVGVRGEIYLFFPLKSPTEILKLTPQRQHASEIAAFADFFGVRGVLSSRIHSFGVREEFFRPAFI